MTDEPKRVLYLLSLLCLACAVILALLFVFLPPQEDYLSRLRHLFMDMIPHVMVALLATPMIYFLLQLPGVLPYEHSRARSDTEKVQPADVGRKGITGTWTGTGRDLHGFKTSDAFKLDTYTGIVLTLKQQGRGVTGSGTVTNEDGQTLSADVVGQVVDDAHFCFIFMSEPPIRDFGAGVAELDGYVRTMRVHVLGNEVNGPGTVLFEMELKKKL